MENYPDNMPKITIPLVITTNDIRQLYDEIENSDNSVLTDFVAQLLKEVDSCAMIQLKNAQEILKVNPYSIKRGIN